MSSEKRVQPTPDQPEQERCPTCGSNDSRVYPADGACYDAFISHGEADPFHKPASPDPPLHQRIEGLIAELEDKAESSVDNEELADFASVLASYLRAVLKAENEGDCTCEPAVGRGAYRVEGEVRRDCPTHGEHPIDG